MKLASAFAHLLRSVYDAALDLAASLECASVALPLLSAGTFGCPPQISLDIALDAIEEHLLAHETSVTLVLYSRSAFKAGLEQFSQIESYIDDNYVDDSYHARFSMYGGAAAAAGQEPAAAPR